MVMPKMRFNVVYTLSTLNANSIISNYNNAKELTAHGENGKTQSAVASIKTSVLIIIKVCLTNRATILLFIMKFIFPSSSLLLLLLILMFISWSWVMLALKL